MRSNDVAVARRIETGDAQPTDQSYVVFRELSARLDAIRQRLDAIMKVDLGEFNSAAAAQGLGAIE